MGSDETMVAAGGVPRGEAGAAPALSAEGWMLRAAACELLAFSLRYPGDELAGAVASGEWAEAAGEIAAALGLALPEGFADGADGGAAEDTAKCDGDDPAALLHTLRAEATRLLVGAPEPACSPYEGVWRAADDGVEALLFVNPHSMAVERFCRSCGLGRPEGTNEPLDHAATELELLQHLASLAAARAAGEAAGGPASAGEGAPADDAARAAAVGAREPAAAPAGAGPSLPDPSSLPGGSPAAAYGRFLREHALAWMPRFASAAAERSRHPFYRAVAALLAAFLASEQGRQ